MRVERDYTTKRAERRWHRNGTLIPIFSGQLIPISRPTPINAGRKIFSAPAESALDVLHTEPNSRKSRVPRTIPRRGARLLRPRRAASKRARRARDPRPPAGQHGARGDAETRKLFLKVGAPRGRTRACASGLYMSRSRHRMPSPALFPNARGLPCERGVDGPEERRARVPAPLHEPPRRREMRFHRVIILKAIILKMPRLRFGRSSRGTMIGM